MVKLNVPRGYGVVIVTRNPKVCDILLRLGEKFGGAASPGVISLPIEDYHPLPELMKTISGITCINESHPPLGDIRQYLTLVVEDPAVAAITYEVAFSGENIECMAGDMHDIRPHSPPGIATYITVEDIRVAFYPPNSREIMEGMIIPY